MTALRRLAIDDQGATAVEYALLLAVLAAVIALLVLAFGAKVRNLFAATNDAFP